MNRFSKTNRRDREVVQTPVRGQPRWGPDEIRPQMVTQQPQGGHQGGQGQTQGQIRQHLGIKRHLEEWGEARNYIS